MNERRISIEGKVALVSGANRGIGKAITIELLENNIKKVYAGARDVNSLNELKEKYGERLIPIELDVTKDETIENVSKTATDVEILVNNVVILCPSTGNTFCICKLLIRVKHSFCARAGNTVKAFAAESGIFELH